MPRNSAASGLARARSRRTGSSSPVRGRSSSTQCGLGRKRQSNTLSTSSGTPCLKPNDMTEICMVLGRCRGEQVDQPLPELVDVEVGRVDDDVGHAPGSARSSSRSRRDGLDHAFPAEGVAAPGALEAPHQHLVGGLQEEDLRPRHPSARSWCHAPSSARRAGRRPGRRPAPPGRSSDPGPATSSATLVIRAVGMLSITNQPRSSRVAAACDRPAPDIPVMIRNSATLPLCAAVLGRDDRLHTGQLLGPQERAGGGWWRPRRTRAARARNPGGGAGSSIRVTSSPASAMALT